MVVALERDARNVAPLIQLDEVAMEFGANTVLEGINFDLNPGEVHALCGENGAGKSTCLGLLYGLHQPSRGKLLRNGVEQRIENPSHAQTLGISCVFQELSLAGALSVAENIYAGRVPTKFGIVDWAELRRRAEALLAEFGLNVDVSMPVENLPVSSRQIVEIAKALSLNARVLLLDEPTSALAPDEVEALFEVLRGLVARGIGIVYVSHHLAEVFRISDRVTVLRDGHHVSTLKISETSQEQLVSEMIGSSSTGEVTTYNRKHGAKVLSIKGLGQPSVFDDISFSINAGEIVGMAGLMGSRRSEIMRSIVGLMLSAKGDVELNGTPVNFTSLRQAMRAGVGFVPEDRKTEGLFLEQSLSDNLIAASLLEHSKLGFMHKRSIKQASEKAIAAFSVKAQAIGQHVGALSGGNQQKIMLAKWLKRAPKLLIIEEPTKGVDVGAKFQIHAELLRCASEGMAILVVSSDFPELVSLSTRILVVHEGRLMGDIAAHEASETALLQMAAGKKTPTPSASLETSGAQLRQ
jgi:ABC-type sugar transport system ATPase subunit